MALYSDETSPLIVVLGETVLIEYLGTIAHWSRSACDGQTLYNKLRSHEQMRCGGYVEVRSE